MFNVEFAIFYLLYGVVLGALAHRNTYAHRYDYSPSTMGIISIVGGLMLLGAFGCTIHAMMTYGFGWGALTFIEILAGSFFSAIVCKPAGIGEE